VKAVRRAKPKRARAPTTTVVVLRLYVTGKAPNSLQAIANLQAICREHLKGAHKLEIVDILEQPRRAMADGILVSPSLAKVFPVPGTSIVGNLSDRAKVMSALGLKEKSS
jgi:circadian clock protein KaiB